MSQDQEISTYEQERRQKLQRLRDLGMDPFGQRTEGIMPLADARAQYKPEHGHDAGPVVKVAGRLMQKRDMGKLSFYSLRDDSGDLQVAIDRKRVDELSWEVRNNVDLGDLVVAEGKLGTTKTGEITVWAKSLAMAAKALVPPPGKWHGLEDVELRYRQRYVDLWANPEVMKLARLRIRVIEEIRNYLKGLGYVEVETPMMQLIHGGAAARPFVTHHNALDIPLYMRIAPELFLKRLLVGGFSKVFEINRNFRNEGISPRHNPEFTMLEAYEAFGSFETMADMVEGLICHVAEKVLDTLTIEQKNAEGQVVRTINLKRPWRRVRMVDLVEERTGWKFNKKRLKDEPTVVINRILDLHRENIKESFVTQMRRAPGGEAISHDLATNALSDIVSRHVASFHDHLWQLSESEQLQEVYEKLVEPTLIDPTFVTHVPSVIIPLARENKDDPYFADVYELAINGVEISPGYSELNDPDVQARHFAHQVGEADQQQKVDEDFLNALRHGMPPAGGMGMGVDRLLMMLTGAESIRDVILFPLMKPV